MLKICLTFYKPEPHQAYKRYAYIKTCSVLFLIGSVSRHQMLKGVLWSDSGLILIFKVIYIFRLVSCKSHSSVPFHLQILIKITKRRYCTVPNILKKFLHTPFFIQEPAMFTWGSLIFIFVRKWAKIVLDLFYVVKIFCKNFE